MAKRGPKLGQKFNRIKPFKTEPGHSGFNKIWLQYKNNAKMRNLPFNLTKDEFKALTSQNCVYCGSKPANIAQSVGKSVSKKFSEHSRYIWNGVDRINSNIGYISSNCVPCCGTCNIMKNKHEAQFFMDHITKIYMFQLSKEI
jgi:hypothetical protein